MVPVLHNQQQAIAELCARFGVIRRVALRELLGGEVDLVMADALTNRYMVRKIERTKQSFYAA